MRAGELYGLQRKRSPSEHIPEADKGLLFGPTKTHETRRIVLPTFLAKMLEEHLASVSGGGEALVFTPPHGEPIHHPNLVRRHFRPAVATAPPERLHRLRFHDLRHTCVALLIAQGVDLFVISRFLGHTSFATTTDAYSHLLPSVHDETRAALDAIYLPDRLTQVLKRIPYRSPRLRYASIPPSRSSQTLSLVFALSTEP